MNKVKLTMVALSANPAAQLAPSEDGINGQLNKSSDGRFYCVVRFEDVSNPFKKYQAVRTYMSNAEGKFPNFTPKQLLSVKGQLIEGAKFVTERVVPYKLPASNGIGENECFTYTTVVLPHESIVTVFKNAGHPIMSEEGEIVTTPQVRVPVE
jgi:hypothetical protein